MPAEAAPSFLLVPELPGPGERLALPQAESHYLTRVCRARPGDRATATDGRGTLALLRLLTGGARALVEVERCERETPVREAWVLVGPPERERGDWMVEKLAELGIAVLQPLDCERGSWRGASKRTGRWQRLAAAALRQSRRRFLLEIRSPARLTDALTALPPGAARWAGDPLGLPAGGLMPPPAGVAVGLLGPAGGLTASERATLEGAAFLPISLSDGRLRTETAVLAWACWWARGGPENPTAARS